MAQATRKKVLITGAAKGQGFNHAKAFADAGCDVALLDITTPIDNIYALAERMIRLCGLRPHDDIEIKVRPASAPVGHLTLATA